MGSSAVYGLWNLWNPATWGVPNAAAWSVWKSLNPYDQESTGYDAFKVREWKKGAAASADGLIPFVDPLSSFYKDQCGNIQDAYIWSRHLAGISRDLAIAALIPNLTLWAKQPWTYEVAQTTQPSLVFKSIEHLAISEKASALTLRSGSSLRAAFSTAWSQIPKTIFTGGTPGANLVLLSGAELYDFRTRME
jgi:hypothetical protein